MEITLDNPIPSNGSSHAEETAEMHYCTIPEVGERVLSPDLTPERARAIILTEGKWMNGTVLHYYFFDDEKNDGDYVMFNNGTKSWRTWVGADNQKEVVRKAFDQWKKVGIGLEFKEVTNREEAEIRIGFKQDDGAWSYMGTYILKIGPNARTMNFGWDLTRGADGMDTALHEIGHTLGLPHEHQNPNAGIVWDEEAVYKALALPPNRWPKETTYYNIIRKLEPSSVKGTNWDPDSIMHYPFGPGLIKQPEDYVKGIKPKGGLSARDKELVRYFYPAIKKYIKELLPYQSVVMNIRNAEQENFLIQPTATRYYNIRTFGACDTIIALFEEEQGVYRYRTADDDSGEDRNAAVRIKLIKGHKYVLRVRLKYSDLSSLPVVMMW